MKYKSVIRQRLETSMGILDSINHGVDTRVMNENDVKAAIGKAGRLLETSMELLDLEHED